MVEFDKVARAARHTKGCFICRAWLRMSSKKHVTLPPLIPHHNRSKKSS